MISLKEILRDTLPFSNPAQHPVVFGVLFLVFFPLSM